MHSGSKRYRFISTEQNVMFKYYNTVETDPQADQIKRKTVQQTLTSKACET